MKGNKSQKNQSVIILLQKMLRNRPSWIVFGISYYDCVQSIWICIFQNFQSSKGSSTGKVCFINVVRIITCWGLYQIFVYKRWNHKFQSLQHLIVFTWNAVSWKVCIYLFSKEKCFSRFFSFRFSINWTQTPTALALSTQRWDIDF